MGTYVEPAARGAVLDPAISSSPARSLPDSVGPLKTEQPHISRPQPAPSRTTSPSTARPHLVALAGLQVVLGYQLFLSGVDKLLYATFPTTLGQLLAGTLHGSAIPAPFAAFLRAVALPNSVVFGYLVEWGETLAGLGLLAGALVALGGPAVRRRVAPAITPWVALAERVIAQLALAAAAGAALMGFTFYLLDGAPSQWVTPSIAFGGALDAGMLLLLGSLALLLDAVVGWRYSTHHLRSAGEDGR
jgi:hypothetical protein